MMPLLALGLIGLMLARRSGTPRPTSKPAATKPGAKPGAKPAPDFAAEAQRIIDETKDIIDGKRDAYSDPDAYAPDDSDNAPAAAAPSAPSAPAPASAQQTDAELARARQAVLLAQQKERLTPPKPGAKPAAKPAPTRVTIGPAKLNPPPTKAAPAGTDLALAKQTAPKVAAHIKQKKGNYDRKVLSLWQTRAGIAPDGIYGRGTFAALKHFYPPAPPALFAQGVASYKPPTGV